MYGCTTLIFSAISTGYFTSSFAGLMINRSVGSLVRKDQSQLKASLNLFLKPINGKIWMNSQINQAKNPLKNSLGRSATALYFDMMARLPLSLYLKGFNASL